MSDPAPPPLVIVEVVTAEHGVTFAEEWYETSMATAAMVEAFQATGVVVWPEEDPDAQGRCIEIEDEITERIFREIQGAAAEAFVRIASEVLTREREQG